MALEKKLDDRTYDDLVDEGIAMISRYAPNWTNRNPSDPGITLIELLAYFTELLVYRLNRVSLESKLRFLKLLRGVKWVESHLPSADHENVDEALTVAVLELRRPQRAVTPSDFEQIIKEIAPNVVRVGFFAGQNLETTDEASREAHRAGHISFVIVTASELTSTQVDILLDQIKNELEPKRLLTTHLHVVKPLYLNIGLNVAVRMRRTAQRDEVNGLICKALTRYFSPVPGGGPDGEGWPFGRCVYISEIYEILDRVAGVDYVEDVCVLHLSTNEKPFDEGTSVGVQIGTHSTVGIDARLGMAMPGTKERLLRNKGGELVGIVLHPYELAKLTVVNLQFISNVTGDVR